VIEVGQMTQATDPLLLAAAEADAEAAAAEAEAVAAQASATAARARARAARLRREAGSSGGPPASGATAAAQPGAPAPVAGTSSTIADDTAPAAEPDEATEPADAADTERAEPGSAASDSDDTAAVPPEKPGKTKRARFAQVVQRFPGRALRRPRGRTLGRAVAGMIVVAALAVSGFTIWNHHQIGVQQAREDAYLEAARQGVLALTSMDSARAADDVRRVLDRSTGAFRTDFQTRSADFTKVVEQSQVATQGEITAAAVESMTDESAVVLVSAVSRITNSAGAQQEPRVWRLSVTVTRDGPEPKMSKVEFVP
jgi:Mce-associated membrane protein